MTDRARVDLLGVPLDPRTAHESVVDLFELVDRAGDCAHLVTLNPEYVMAARRDATFQAAIARADLILADGAGVVLAARWLGAGVVERLTGVEIVERLAERGACLFFLGAGPGVAVAAAEKLSARYSRARIGGIWAAGSAHGDDDAEALERVAVSGATVVAVAYGARGQVFWIDRNREALTRAGVRLALGVGGAFDYLAETSARPPARIRRLGLEWLWRLGREPWRWRRQLVLPKFALLTVFAGIHQRLRR